MRALYLAIGFAVPAVAQTPTSSQTADSASIAIVPRPESLTVGRGRFVINANTVIYTDAASADIARRFAASLLPATGLSILVRVGAAPATGIVLERNQRLTRLGDEGYELSVTTRRVSIRARERAGVFYGLQTVRQVDQQSVPLSG